MQPEDSIVQFLMPLNLGFFAAIFLTVFWRSRELRFVAFIAAAFAVAALGSAIEIFHQSLTFDPFHFDDFTNLCYCLVSVLLVLALAERYQTKKPWMAIAMLGCLGVTGQYYLGHYAPDLEMRTVVIDTIAGSLMTLTLWVIPLRSERLIDRTMFWLFAAIALSYFARIGIVIAFLGADHQWGAYAHSIYVTVLFFATSLAAMGGGVAMLVLTAIDIFDKYRAEAMTDPLTGLLNRRGFQEILDRINAKAEQPDAPAYAILALDLDRFKQVNDAFGHGGGDAVLRRVGKMISSLIEGHGKAVRVGGEEFVIILNETSSKARAVFAEHLRVALGLLVHPELSTNMSVTVSCGIALMHRDEAAQSALRRADVALYAAKAKGRDCIVDSDADIAGPTLKIVAGHG